MSPPPHQVVLRAASAMASAAIACGMPERVAVERANNIAQILGLSTDPRISTAAKVIREAVQGTEATVPRHELVASVGTAWALTIEGCPLDQVAEELHRQELTRRETVRGAVRVAS